MTTETAATPPDPASRPVLPAPAAASSGSASAAAAAQLRRFHFAPQTSQSETGGGLLPAVLRASRGGEGADAYPLFLAPPAAGEGTFHVALGDLLRRSLPADETAAAMLRQHLDGLERQVRRSAAGGGEPVDAGELLADAARRLVRELGESTEAAAALATALDGLRAAVPPGGKLLPYSSRAPLHLLLHAARCRQLAAPTAFREEARAVAELAAGLLDAGSGGGDDAGDTMGDLGARFIDPTALASVRDPRRGGPELAGERRDGLAAALATLEAFLAEPRPSALVLVHDGHGFGELERLEDNPASLAEDPCAAAAELFDREAEALAEVLRAVRRIRLETEGSYDPGRHDPWLAQLDWRAFSRDELLLLPPVVALVAAERAAGASLSRLLLSGRPVQILISLPPAANPGAAEPLASYRLEPAYLGLSHRQALVQQSSAARPEHLLQGFHRALGATHTGLHVLAADGGSSDAVSAPRRAAAALESRAHPLFCYDPEAGASWAARLGFAHNPDAEHDWPRRELPVRRHDGSDDVLPLAFTFADFALLDPAYAAHFRAVPAAVPESELVPVAEHCAAPPEDDDHRVPFIWAVDGDHRLLRLAISRPLALACRDRLDFWRTLQELAGVRSEHVDRAVAQARADAEQRARQEREQLEAAHAAELEHLRRDAAEEVATRMTAALLEIDVAELIEPEPAAMTGGDFRGRDVDEVAAQLLRLVEPGSLDADSGAGGGEQVEEMASRLLGLVDG